MNATPVIDFLPVTNYGVYDGVAWFATPVHDLDFDAYKRLPRLLKYQGRMFVKMSFNTDTGNVAYQETDAVAQAFGINL